MAKKFKGDIQVDNNANVDGVLTLPAQATDRATQINSSGEVESSAVTSTELGHLSGVTSGIQSQINSKANTTDVVLRDGSQDFNADQSMGGFKLTNLAAPTNDNDAARKADVDAAIAGQKTKDPVDLVSTSNITLSGEQTIDGVLTSTSRVLVAGQTTATENGIYTTDAGAWTRTTDFDGNPNGEVRLGNTVFVESGTANANAMYILNTTNAADDTNISVGSEEIGFTIYSRAEAITAGTAIDKSGLVVSVDITNTTAETVADDADEILIHDDTAGLIRKQTRANFLSGLPRQSIGDLDETGFAGANNQTLPADVTGFVFANAQVRSFQASGSIVVDADSDLFEAFEIQGIQKGASWEISDTRTGDDSLVTFSITNAGQIQYTSSNYTGFVSLDIKFRAVTTSI
jgi:hypothetical protein